MARKLRVAYSGAIYHVMLRGNWRQNIFRSDNDRTRLLKRLKESANTYNTRIHLFCLMTNHIHFVLETPEGNISRFMQSFTTGYTVYYNLCHNQSGHLFQGRFKAKLVESNSYLLALSRYVHLNPVFIDASKNLPLADRIKMLREYKWSSYRSYIGLSKPLDFVDYTPTLGLTPSKSIKKAQKYYRKYVETGIAKSDNDFISILKESHHAIGSREFTDMVDKLYQELINKKGIIEDISFRQEISRIPKNDIIYVICTAMGLEENKIYKRQRNNMVRPVAAHMLCKFSGMTQREVAKVLNIGSGAAVSLQLKKLNEQLSQDKTLSTMIEEITSKLNSMRHELSITSN